MSSRRILAIVHVYYPERWGELAACLRNLGPADLVLTAVDAAAVEAAHRDFPSAKVVLCENRGYDVWPFLKALASVDLAAYDLVVKLHTKRDLIHPGTIVVGHTWLNGPRWRDHLLAFVRTPQAWRKTLRRFRRRKVGMVADRHVIFFRRDAEQDKYRLTFDRACRRIADTWGLAVPPNAAFVGGTMFVARAALLRPFVAAGFTADRFDVTAGHDSETLAHELERMFGLMVAAQGFRLVAFNGSLVLRRILYALRKFLYQDRRSDRRRSIRICCVTVYRKKYCE